MLLKASPRLGEVPMVPVGKRLHIGIGIRIYPHPGEERVVVSQFFLGDRPALQNPLVKGAEKFGAFFMPELRIEGLELALGERNSRNK